MTLSEARSIIQFVVQQFRAFSKEGMGGYAVEIDWSSTEADPFDPESVHLPTDPWDWEAAPNTVFLSAPLSDSLDTALGVLRPEIRRYCRLRTAEGRCAATPSEFRALGGDATDYRLHTVDEDIALFERHLALSAAPERNRRGLAVAVGLSVLTLGAVIWASRT